jgi:hypothetical protein
MGGTGYNEHTHLANTEELVGLGLPAPGQGPHLGSFSVITRTF